MSELRELLLRKENLERQIDHARGAEREAKLKMREAVTAGEVVKVVCEGCGGSGVQFAMSGSNNMDVEYPCDDCSELGYEWRVVYREGDAKRRQLIDLVAKGVEP